MDKIDTYCSAGATVGGHAVVNSDGSIPCTSNVFGGSDWAFAPDGIRYSQVDYDRHRRGLAFAGQYENLGGNLRATVQYINSKYHNAWIEHASHAILDGNYFGTPAFNPRGGSTVLGAAVDPALILGRTACCNRARHYPRPWQLAWELERQRPDAINAVAACLAWRSSIIARPAACTTLRDGLYFQTSRAISTTAREPRICRQHPVGCHAQLHPNLDAAAYHCLDVQQRHLGRDRVDGQLPIFGELDGTPQVTLEPGSNVNYATGGLANPHNYWIPFIQGHVEDNDAHENALRGDLKYDFEHGSWLNSLKVGVRYADRHQTVRYSTFNWTPIAASWNCNGAGFNADNTQPDPTAACNSNFKGYGANIFGPYNFGGLYNGDVYPNGSLVFVNNNVLTDYKKLMAGLAGANSPLGNYTPICDRAGTTDCFLPSEVMKLRERRRRPTRCSTSAATTGRSSTESRSSAMSASA